jgi:hypothetical protein
MIVRTMHILRLCTNLLILVSQHLMNNGLLTNSRRLPVYSHTYAAPRHYKEASTRLT